MSGMPGLDAMSEEEVREDGRSEDGGRRTVGWVDNRTTTLEQTDSVTTQMSGEGHYCISRSVGRCRVAVGLSRPRCVAWPSLTFGPLTERVGGRGGRGGVRHQRREA